MRVDLGRSSTERQGMWEIPAAAVVTPDDEISDEIEKLITLHVKMSVSAECDEFETAQKAVCDLFRRGQISEPFDSIKYNDAGTNNSEDVLQWRWNDTTFSFLILNTETLSTSQY